MTNTQSGIHTGMTNTKNTPIESLVQHYPLRITAYGLRSGSGDEGCFGGGEGIVREMEFLEDATVTLMGERRVTRPWGLQGGGPGAVGEDWLIRPSSGRELLPGKVTLKVQAGDRLRVLTPRGGAGAPLSAGRAGRGLGPFRLLFDASWRRLRCRPSRTTPTCRG